MLRVRPPLPGLGDDVRLAVLFVSCGFGFDFYRKRDKGKCCLEVGMERACVRAHAGKSDIRKF